MSQQAFTHIAQVAAREHPELADALAAFGPVELTPDTETTLAEKLCRSIAGQQLSVKAASTIWSRVEAQVTDEDIIRHLHHASNEQLRACGLSTAKTRAIKEIAQKVTDNILDGDALQRASSSERSATLLALWGVGQWTVDMTNIFFYAEPDVWPNNDVTAVNTLLRLAGGDDAELIASHYSPYRSYLALFMYKIADARPD